MASYSPLVFDSEGAAKKRCSSTGRGPSATERDPASSKSDQFHPPIASLSFFCGVVGDWLFLAEAGGL